MGTSKHTLGPPAYAELGWTTQEHRADQTLLTLFATLLHAPDHGLMKTLIQHAIADSAHNPANSLSPHLNAHRSCSNNETKDAQLDDTTMKRVTEAMPMGTCRSRLQVD